MGKTVPFPIGASFINQTSLFFGTLIKGDHMIISANLQSTLSISFWEEDFQRINMHYNGKNSPTPMGASFINRASLL